MNPSQHDLESGVQRPTKLCEEAAQRPTDLHEEAHDMLLNAFLTFCMPDRAMARQDPLKGDKERLPRVVEQLPTTLEDVVTVHEENIELLTKERLKDEKRAEMCKDALTLKRFNLDEKTRKELSRDIFLIHFEDSKEEDECVCCISLNNASKRVGIYFRGSVTKKDFRQDAKAMVGRIDNPVNAVHLLLAEELGVHLGFRECLCKEEKLVKALLPLRTIRKADNDKRPTTNKDPSLPSLITDKPNAKLELEDERIPRKMKHQIILEQVRELFKEHPDCRLCIAGHSLGGALTTLMALEAGADEATPKPVTTIASGAPKVGNLAFNRAFEELERQKKLRCLQIANDRDPVPASPPDAWNPSLAMFCQSRRFRHVGLRLKLRSNGHILFSPPKMRTCWGVLLCDCMHVSRTWMIIILFAFLSLFCFASCFFSRSPR
jgi:hypothetical protein